MGIIKKLFKRELSLSERLRREALGMGMCESYRGLWSRELDEDSLLELYRNGTEFTMEHDWPKPDFIRENFDKKLLRRHGVWLDEDGMTFPYQGGGVRQFFLGNCIGTVEAGQFEVRLLYIRHNSDINVIAGDNSFVQVDVYDSAKVHIVQTGNSTVSVYHHGGEIETTGIVKIHKR